MCWTPPFTKQKTQHNMWDTTTHKTKDEDKQNKKHNTICVGHHHAQEKDQDKQNKKHSTICV